MEITGRPAPRPDDIDIPQQKCPQCNHTLQSQFCTDKQSLDHPCSLYKFACPVALYDHVPAKLYFCATHHQLLKNSRTCNNHLRVYKSNPAQARTPSPISFDFPASSVEDSSPSPEPSLIDHLEPFHPSTRRFILDESIQRYSGPTHLVKRAFESTNSTQPSAMETYFHLFLSRFLMSLTQSQQEQFFTISRIIFSNARQLPADPVSSTLNSLFTSRTTRLPFSREDYHRIYTRSVHSISRSMPSPSVAPTQKGDSFAFCTFRECIQHYLAMGNSPFDLASYVSEETNVPLVYQEIMQSVHNMPGSPTYIIMIDEWRDKFDVNEQKKNRGSVFANTITFVGENKSYATDPVHTYAVCLGLGTYSANYCEMLLLQELRELTSQLSWFYSPRHQKMVLCAVKFRSSIQDRVERNSHTCLLSHSSYITRRWGYVAAFDLSGLVSCDRCYRRRVENLIIAGTGDITPTINSCPNCGDYGYHEVPRQFFDPIPVEYPKQPCPCGNCPPFAQGRSVPPGEFLPVIKLEFTWIRQVIASAAHHRKLGIWSPKEVLCYLRLSGINSTVGNSIEDVLNAHPDIQESLLVEQSLPFPYFRDLPIRYYTEAGMHILKGIAENVVSLLFSWNKKNRLNPIFTSYCNSWIKNINLLSLSWMKLIPFGGNKADGTGGWVSENHINFMRLIPFLFSNSVRANVSAARWANLCNPKKAHGAVVAVPIRLSLAALAVFSRCLADTKTWQKNPNRLENSILEYVKWFLREVSTIDRSSKWKGKGNPVSLLNIPQNFAFFGSLRETWDGNHESSASFLKAHTHNIRKRSQTFFPTKLKKINRHRSLTSVMRQVEARLSPDELEVFNPTEEAERHSLFKVYRSKDQIQFGYEFVPTSTVMVTYNESDTGIRTIPGETRGCFVAVWADGKEVGDERACILFDVDVDVRQPRRLFSKSPIEMYSATMPQDVEPIRCTLGRLKQNVVSEQLFLPQDGFFWIINSEWRCVLGEEGQFRFPVCHLGLFMEGDKWAADVRHEHGRYDPTEENISKNSKTGICSIPSTASRGPTDANSVRASQPNAELTQPSEPSDGNQVSEEFTDGLGELGQESDHSLATSVATHHTSD